MASIGHVLVGAAASKAYRSGQRARWSAVAAAAAWSALSMLPDADVIGFKLGVRYADPWGHRGATHSFVFALAVAALVALIARAAKLPGWRTFLVAAAVVASHPLLDTMTDGGLGCALLWPFSDERFLREEWPLVLERIQRLGLSSNELLQPAGGGK